MTSDPERKCFRLIGGVLVQRTVKDVVPALETNYAGIKDVLETLVKTYKGKEEEFAAFQREHKIVVSLSSGGHSGRNPAECVVTPSRAHCSVLSCSALDAPALRSGQAVLDVCIQLTRRCPDANKRIIVSDPCIPCIWLSSMQLGPRRRGPVQASIALLKLTPMVAPL